MTETNRVTPSIRKTYGPHRGGPVWIKNTDTDRPGGRTIRCTLAQLLGGRRWSLVLATDIAETPGADPDTSPVDPLVFATTVHRAAEMYRSDEGEGSLPWAHLTDEQKVPYLMRAYAIETTKSADA